MTALEQDYIVGVQGNATAWPQGKRLTRGANQAGHQKDPSVGWRSPAAFGLAKALPGGL